MALLLQIATLLPPAPTFEAAPDAVYQNTIQEFATAETWPSAGLTALAPKRDSHNATLAGFLHGGSQAEVRLSAILGAGCSGESPLAFAFWRRAALELDEAQTVACLLAPASVPSEVLPMLAWMATDAQRSLPVRATALARLLDADQTQVWPLVRSVLRTGTAEDVVAPGADWERGGRYELPKRILLLSIQDLLRRHELGSTDFEPNAAWRLQLVQLVALEQHILQLPKASVPKATQQSEPWSKLLLLVDKKGAHAALAHALLNQ